MALAAAAPRFSSRAMAAEMTVESQLSAAARLAAEGRPFDAIQQLFGALKTQPREPRLRQALAASLQEVFPG